MPSVLFAVFVPARSDVYLILLVRIDDGRIYQRDRYGKIIHAAALCGLSRGHLQQLRIIGIHNLANDFAD